MHKMRISSAILGFSFFLAIQGCGGGGDTSTNEPTRPTTPPPTPPPTPAAPTPLSDPIPEAIAQGEIQVKATSFIKSNDSLGDPSTSTNPYTRIRYMKQTPGLPKHYFFSDARGTLEVFEETWSEPQTYLDLRSQNVGFTNATYENESGLMGFAFHPQFSETGSVGYGKLYTAFSATSASGEADFIESDSSVQESVVMEWQITDHTEIPWAGENRKILRIGQFAPNHNIGSIAFNPTASPDDSDYGMLYVTLGDGGQALDPRNHGQNARTPLGAILRIDPLGGEDGGKAYGIPADNPFADGTDGLPEVWAYGLRHPQHLSWDTVTKEMYFIDFGQDQIEEVNKGVSGANYGWRIREGTFATSFGVELSSPTRSVYERPSDTLSLTYPVVQYDHDEGFAISSAFVYRGTGFPELTGKLVVAELSRGRLFYTEASSLEANNPQTLLELQVSVDETGESLIDVAGYPNSFGNHRPYVERLDLRLSVDLEGELYVLTMGDGWIRKLVPNED